jgi:alkanesulfonate monooxygenase SsuD/methylene tetrahydromethanopterin reductase-like flavin-dependent oxidoreductase (luciferase family)
VQAGSSDDGKDFAARHAEAVFTAQQTLDDGQAFYADLKRRVALAGRDPDGVKILPGLVPVIGSTEAEAEALALDAELDRLILAEHARDRLARRFGFDQPSCRWTSRCLTTCPRKMTSRERRAATR